MKRRAHTRGLEPRSLRRAGLLLGPMVAGVVLYWLYNPEGRQGENLLTAVFVVFLYQALLAGRMRKKGLVGWSSLRSELGVATLGLTGWVLAFSIANRSLGPVVPLALLAASLPAFLFSLKKARDWRDSPLRLFLSYARVDQAQVEDLYQRLEDAGFKPWMDRKDILPGKDWDASIHSAILNSHCFLFCITRRSVEKLRELTAEENETIRREVERALDVEQTNLAQAVSFIPIRLEDVDSPEEMTHLQWVDLFEPSGWERLLESLGSMSRRAGRDR